MACTIRGHVFDFEGHHPNCLPKGGKTMFRNAVKYLKKDGFFGGTLEDEDDIPITKGEECFRMALDAPNADTFTSILNAGIPKDFIKSYINISACQRDLFAIEARKWTSTRTTTDFTNVPQAMLDYATYITSDTIIEHP